MIKTKGKILRKTEDYKLLLDELLTTLKELEQENIILIETVKELEKKNELH